MKTISVYDPVTDLYYEWKEDKPESACFAHEPFVRIEEKDRIYRDFNDPRVKDVVLDMRLRFLGQDDREFYL